MQPKTIQYRGGIATFQIPSHWKEEYDPKGGATFYEDKPNSGTFRLSVLSFDSRSGERAEQMASRAFPAGTFETLPSGLRLQREAKAAKEGSETLAIYWWRVAVPVPPSSLRLANFSYTILAGQESEPAIASELAFVDKSVRVAEFRREPAVAGDYRP